MKIAAYTGTFNPLHTGHLTIMKYLTENMDFDMVYLVVSPQSPFKLHINAETGAERYRAAEEAIARHPGLKVRADDIELHLPAPQYTIRTLDALKSREPGNDFTLIMGADNLMSLNRWRDYRRILTDYGVAVYPRKGYDIHTTRKSLMQESEDACRCSHGTAKPYKIEIINAPVVEISSSEIREGIAAGRDMSKWLM